MNKFISNKERNINIKLISKLLEKGNNLYLNILCLSIVFFLLINC